MKKAILWCTAFLLCLSMCGCGDTSAPQDTTPQDTAATDIASVVNDKNADKVIRADASFTPDPDIGFADDDDLHVDHVFSDGFVLQRNAVNRIYGKTSASHVAALFGGERYYGTVTAGEFSIYLPPMPANGTPRTLSVVTETGRFDLADVRVGEVFVCAGQSNMQTTMRYYGDTMGCTEHRAQVEAASDPLLRLYTVPLSMQGVYEPKDELDGRASWSGADPDSVLDFSATGYLFGRRMREALDMPIGLIACALGGSSVGYWLPKQDYRDLVQEGYRITIDAGAQNPAVGYNQAIHPVRGLKVRGVIWYQGETSAMNGTTVALYEAELTRLMSAWRRVFDNDAMTFSLVGLPRFEQSYNGYANVRTAEQNIVARDALACMTCNLDDGMWDDIHPYPKTTLAVRLADETLHRFFGIATPRYPSVARAKRISATEVRLVYRDVGEGLTLRDGNTGFEVREDNGRNYSADVTVTVEDKNTLVVTASTPFRYVRYGVAIPDEGERTAGNYCISLYNSLGMPADQFVLDLG